MGEPKKSPLTYIEREMFKLRYGLGNGDGYIYTLEEIGHIFKVSRERVRTRLKRARIKIKELLQEPTDTDQQHTPDLLAALEALVEWAELAAVQLDGEFSPGGTPTEPEEIIRARAAIAAARCTLDTVPHTG